MTQGSQMYTREQLFIDGKWKTPTGGSIDVVSPHSEAVIGRVVSAAPADVELAVAAARVAFDDGQWPRLRPMERIGRWRS
jgi:acyl-CoA reductase-like NAD-dependent aldehyde dehydrogenase